MKIFFGGVRGTTPRAAPRFTRYGGHTTCLLVTGRQGELLLLDAGSGVQEVNPLLLESSGRELLVLLSHLHLDHIMGLPTLAPLYDGAWTVDIACGGRGVTELAAGLERVTTPPVWPVALKNMGARINLREFPAGDGPVTWGGLRITSAAVPHPNGCHAWRVEEPASGAALVFATDTEWSDTGAGSCRGLVSLCRLPRPADLLIMDGQFAAEELPAHAGWGHSSVEQCAEAATLTGVGRLLVTHHDPDHDDARLAAMEAELAGLDLPAAFARQGQTLTLGQ